MESSTKTNTHSVNKIHCVGFEEYLKSQAFSSKSIKQRMMVVDMFWDWLERENLEAEQVSYNDLMAFVECISKKGVSQRTIQHYMGTVKHFYHHLLSEGKITTNPAADIAIKGVKRKTLYTPLETHELHKLYHDYSDKTARDRRNKVMLGLLVYQGLKTTELAKLEVKDVKLREGKIDVPGGRKSNGRIMQLESHQVMDMYDFVLKVRNEILALSPKRKCQERQETDKLFIGDGGNTASFSNYMTQLMIKVRQLNPSVVNAKHLRACVITKWLRMYNLREVQYLSGHRYISSTESYQENDMKGLQEEVKQYHPLG